MNKKISATVLFFALLAGCGGGGSTQSAPPTCSPGGGCPGTGYLAVAQSNGIGLYLSPFSGSAHAAIGLANVSSFASFPTVDIPTTVLAAVPPNTLYTFDYPYAAPDGSFAIPVGDISQMQFINVSSPAGAGFQLLIADSVNNDLALVNVGSKPATVTRTIGGLDHPNAFFISYAAAAPHTVWVAEASDIAEFSYQTDGTFTRVSTLSSGLTAPAGVTGYSDGSIYVSDTGKNAIEVFPPNATSPAFAVSAGLNEPRAMFDSLGTTLYVANTGDYSIAAFSLPLTASSTPLWVNHNLTGTPRAMAGWFSPSF